MSTLVFFEKKKQDKNVVFCSCDWALRANKINHYENMPIQKYWKFYHQKMKIFR